jgi:sugar lactone lactonase YvrE
VSGSATLAGQKHTILGALDTSLSADPSANLLIKRSPASLGDLRLQINLSPAENKLTGSITDPRYIMRPGSLELGNPTEQGLVNGTMEEARFSGPRGVVLNIAGNGYIADTGHHVIRFVDAANNVVSTFAGSGSSGSADGTGTASVFNSPEGLALDASGNLYVADSGNATIRRISPAGVVTTFAGSAGQVGTVNGTGAGARFNQPCALCLDPLGNLYVADRGSHTIRKITPLGVVTTLAGKADTAGHKDASGISALFNSPRGITYDPLLKALFVADTNNFVIRKVTLAGATTTYAGSAGVAGSNEGLLANARFLAPSGIISMGDGTLVVADTLLVQINANGTCGIISDYLDAVNRNDHPVALALNPTDRSLIVAHDTLHAITGHGANGQSAPSADFVAWRNVWSSTRLVPVANQGLYNAALQTTAPTNELSIPQGHGYAQLSISKSGGANWTGKAADGSTLTFSTVLAEDDSIPLHVMLYGNTGSLQGVAKINFVTGDLTDHAEHVLDWCKIPQPLVSKDRSYKSGFITTLEMKGGRYTPNDLHGFLGLSGSSAAMRLIFAQSPTETFEQPFTLMDPNGVVVPSNNKSLSLKMDPKTGIFTGSYKQGNPALTVNYAGILLNHQASNEKKGLGHFLKAESSSPTSKIWSAPVAVGKSGPE